MPVRTLSVFNDDQFNQANDLLAAKVSTMLGRKMEEGDWDFVYCHAKSIPHSGWSNLNIDINHNGLGVEHKMLRITKCGPILEQCGTTKMHPAGTRSIRIPSEDDPNKAMKNILNQYNELIDQRSNSVRENSSDNSADMRIGWLLWKDALDEFIYFEEAMIKPNANHFFAQWHETPARGTRKASKSLWIFNKETGQKRYSVTTEAGAKIQPYFDVPTPDDSNLYYFKVQGNYIDGGLVKIWLTRGTAKYLELLIGSLDADDLSDAIDNFQLEIVESAGGQSEADKLAVQIFVKQSSYERLKSIFPHVSDEFIFQQLAIKLGENDSEDQT